MDTRSKIISNAEAVVIAKQGATIVSGYFDPLLAAHAERLRGLKQAGNPLLILIASPADAILPARARAELVAALACVDHVTEIGAAFPDGLAPHTQLETEDAARLQELIAHVAMRQQAAG
ncbi:MAG: hypothetical protein ABI811_22725 [Acidobacteriota bacterium]